MKKKTFILLLILVFFSNNIFAQDLIKELDELKKLYNQEILTKEEFTKAKKKVIDIDNNQKKTNKTNQLSKKEKKELDYVFNYVKSLGSFSEPKYYPRGMLDFFGGNCSKWHCRQNKALQQMVKIFKRTSQYNDRHPGSMSYGMAYFEIFYLSQLKKNQKKINKFLLNWPDKSHGKEIVKLLKLKKARNEMRKALGMKTNITSEEAMNNFWTLGNFLESGELKKQKVSKTTKKREVLLAKYQKVISEFKSSLQKNKDEEIYKKIYPKYKSKK